MADFSLIKTLNKDQSPSPLAKGVSYQQYEVEVDGNPQIISIPLREGKSFETALIEFNKPLTRKALKLFLREFRGVRG